MNGILWVLRTGAAWMELPDRFPSGSTCFRRFSVWVKTGVLRQILEAIAHDLEDRSGIDLSECFIDGTFVLAKKGAPRLERPSGARVRSSWLLLTLMVFHSPCTRLLLAHMKSPLSKPAIDGTFTVGRLGRIIGDRAYDSDPLDERLAEKGVKLIAPHRTCRVRPATQDGRALRRYSRRWKVERFFAWLNKYKKVITRYDRNITHYNGFVYLACSMILMRSLIKHL